MRRKIVKVMLMTVMVTSLMMTGVGCGAQENPTEEKVEETTVEVSKDTLKELKKYVPLIDKVKIMEHSKNVDLNKVMNSLIDESKKEEVASLTVDASKVNVEKVGTYGVGITLVTKTPKKATTNKETEEKQPEKQKTEKPQNNKQPESTDNSVIVGNVDVEVVDKDVLPDLKDDVVVEENNKVEVPKPSEKPSKEEDKKPSDDKKPDKKPSEDKKPDKKPEEDKKPSANKPSENKKPVAQKPSTESKPTSKPQPSKPAPSKPAPEPSKPAPAPTPEPSKPAPQPAPQPAPEPPVVNHYWVPETKQEQVWIEDYEFRTFCTCGADITDCMDMHYADGCNGSYYVQQVPNGGHYETQTVETGRYICSGCGAIK